MKSAFSFRARRPARWRQLGVLTLLAFTVKGLVTSSMIVWALLRAWP